MADVCHLKIENCNITAVLWLISTKFCIIMHTEPQGPEDR